MYLNKHFFPSRNIRKSFILINIILLHKEDYIISNILYFILSQKRKINKIPKKLRGKSKMDKNKCPFLGMVFTLSKITLKNRSLLTQSQNLLNFFNSQSQYFSLFFSRFLKMKFGKYFVYICLHFVDSLFFYNRISY
jgi:hypothetical protein